jgi:hypothetical protein
MKITVFSNNKPINPFFGLMVYGFMGLWVYGFMGLWVYGLMGLWVYVFRGLWVYGCMGLCVYGFVGLWVYLWVYGLMRLWVSVFFQFSRTTMHTSIPSVNLSIFMFDISKTSCLCIYHHAAWRNVGYTHENHGVFEQ